VNVRDEEARLTESERLVYAAAFALESTSRTPDFPRRTVQCAASAWVAVLKLRDDQTSRWRLGQSIDWSCVDDMLRSFRG
jgi:hypothetical protein